MQDKILNNKLLAKNENGELTEYEILAIITLDSGMYIAFTDGKLDSNEKISLRINSLFYNEDNSITLDTIDQEELVNVLEKLKERLK